MSWCILGGVIALIGSLVGSAIGIAKAAVAGTATLAEDPSQFRNVIVLASMPMTQSFYGLIVMLIILTAAIPAVQASASGASACFAVLGVGFICAVAEFFSAIFQGGVCASGIAQLPKTKGGIFTSTMMLAVFVELLGVLGLVFTIMALSLLGLM